MQPVERITCSLYNTSVDMMLISLSYDCLHDMINDRLWHPQTFQRRDYRLHVLGWSKWLFRDVTNHAICQGRDGAELLLAACSKPSKPQSKKTWAVDQETMRSKRHLDSDHSSRLSMHCWYIVLTKLCLKILVPLVLIIHFIADERSFIKDQAVWSGFGLPSFPGVWNPPNMPTSRSLDFSYSILLHYTSTLLLKCII